LRTRVTPRPGRVMSCACARKREAACAAQAEGESSGQDDERAEAAGGGERLALAAEMMSELKLQAAASVTPVGRRAARVPSSARRPVPPK